jgi:hypothetical protein
VVKAIAQQGRHKEHWNGKLQTSDWVTVAERASVATLRKIAVPSTCNLVRRSEEPRRRQRVCPRGHKAPSGRRITSGAVPLPSWEQPEQPQPSREQPQRSEE